MSESRLSHPQLYSSNCPLTTSDTQQTSQLSLCPKATRSHLPSLHSQTSPRGCVGCRQLRQLTVPPHCLAFNKVAKDHADKPSGLLLFPWPAFSRECPVSSKGSMTSRSLGFMPTSVPSLFPESLLGPSSSTWPLNGSVPDGLFLFLFFAVDCLLLWVCT